MSIVLIGNDLQLTAGATVTVLDGWGYGGGYRLNRFHFDQVAGATYQVEVAGSGVGQFVQIA